MKALKWVAVLLLVGVLVGSCGPMVGEPSLTITLTPNVVTSASPVVVRVTATKGDGAVGSGTVRVTSARGSLTTPVDLTLDGFGTARTELVCDPVAEPECRLPVRVAAEWTVAGVQAIAEARLNSGVTGTGGGAGGGTGTGGGAGSGEYTDGGLTILSNECRLPTTPGPDARCCYVRGASTTAPTCGWVKIKPGAVAGIGFTLVDGGSPNSLAYVRYGVPGGFSSINDCLPSFTLELMPGGVMGSFTATCYQFAVFPDDSWQLVDMNGDGCEEQASNRYANYWQADCEAAFSRNWIGSVRLMSNATITNTTTNEQWVMSDPNVLVFTMPK